MTSSNPSPSRLLIFLKAPRIGTVKTRLAESLGKEKTCLAYCALVETLLSNLSRSQNIELHFAPKDARDEISDWLQPGWTAIPQCDGNLGCRLSHAFETAFASGARRVAIIGSDCPYVSADDIDAAWDALDKADLVLGPATDGGYWLIGLSKPEPKLFRDMPWSTDHLFDLTLEKAAQCGLKVHLLRELEDVDTIAEWLTFMLRKRESTADGG